MSPETEAWLAGIREFIATRRRAHPMRPSGAPGAAAEAERSLLREHLGRRLATLDAVLQSRRVSARGGIDPDPVVVVTTSLAGLAAAADLLAGDVNAAVDPRRIVPLTELEYRLWCVRSPDERFARHLAVWSWIKTRVPSARNREFVRHPLAAGEDYWLHRSGIAGAGGADGRDCQLWKWDGHHVTLLEPHVHERAGGPLGTPPPRA